MELAERSWWALTPDEALSALQSGADGLSQTEADDRLGTFGSNELAARGGNSPAAILLRQFTSPLIYILAGVGTIALVRAFS